MGGKLARALDTEQKGSQAGVMKVELRGFDEPFSKVGEVRRKAKDDIASA